MSAPLLEETRGPSLWLTINRPRESNSLNRPLLASIEAALHSAATTPHLRAVVITGAGDRAFCAGADLKEAQASTSTDVFAQSTGTANPLVATIRAMRRFPKPILARVNGAAYAGGLGLLAGCDLAYAADHARFALPEVKIGLFPMMIAGPLLRQLPRRRFIEMAFLGEPLTAADAARYNLINAAVPAAELDATVDRVIARLVENSPNALAVGKKALDTMQDLSLDDALDAAQPLIESLAKSDEAREGMAAFAEKRKPRWS